MADHNRFAGCAIVALALSACSSVANNPDALPPSAGAATRDRAGIRQNSSPTLYISDLNASVVTLYPANVPSPSPIATISSGISSPKGIWVDKAGTLYVANSQLPNSNVGTVTEYPAGASLPSLTIQTNFKPTSVATDSKGNLYVAADDGFTVAISEYAPGSTKPMKTVFPTSLQGDPFMGGLTVDEHDNLYAAFFVYKKPPTHVVRFAPGLRREHDLQLAGLDGIDLAPGLGRDATGNLYVGIYGVQINVYPPGSKNPSRNIMAGNSEYFTVASNGALYTPNGDFIDEFLPGSQSPIQFAGVEHPEGAAIH